MGGIRLWWGDSWGGPWGQKHSRDIAVGSSHHPVGADEGASAEMEATGVLEVRRQKRDLSFISAPNTWGPPQPGVHTPAEKPARARSRALRSRH